MINFDESSHSVVVLYDISKNLEKDGVLAVAATSFSSSSFNTFSQACNINELDSDASFITQSWIDIISKEANEGRKMCMVDMLNNKNTQRSMANSLHKFLEMSKPDVIWFINPSQIVSYVRMCDKLGLPLDLITRGDIRVLNALEHSGVDYPRGLEIGFDDLPIEVAIKKSKILVKYVDHMYEE